MRIIFLDIDGVLNSHESALREIQNGTPTGVLGLCPLLVDKFKQLVQDVGTQVVLSSTWRMRQENVRVIESAGITLFGLTPILPNEDRAVEIQTWLSENSALEIEDFVVIDDDSDANCAGHFYQTKFARGLTDTICDAIRARWA